MVIEHWAVGLVVAALALQVSDATPTYELWITVSSVITVIITWGISQLPPHFNALAKRLICALAAGLMALVSVYYAGQLDTTDWARTWLIIFMAATTIYVTLAKPTAVHLSSRDPRRFADV